MKSGGQGECFPGLRFAASRLRVWRPVYGVLYSTLLPEDRSIADGCGVIAVAPIFERIPGAGINKHGVHSMLPLFAVEVFVMPHRRIR